MDRSSDSEVSDDFGPLETPTQTHARQTSSSDVGSEMLQHAILSVIGFPGTEKNKEIVGNILNDVRKNPKG